MIISFEEAPPSSEKKKRETPYLFRFQKNIKKQQLYLN